MSNIVTEISKNNSLYPKAVSAPIRGATLACIGNLDLLSKNAIGICGSRKASDEALNHAWRFGSEAANRGLVVVSGYARGIDREAHKGALESGGRTIAVLPEGINYFRVNRELKPYVELNDNFLAVSMFPAAAKWRAWQAMERNKLVIGLSSDVFVIEAASKGGTMEAANECIRQRKNLWAVAYSEYPAERAGSLSLIQGKARSLAQMDEVKLALDKIAMHTEKDIEQQATMELG